jgi:hypothetical protein
MAHKIYKDAVVKIDGAAATIVDITGSCNNASVSGALALIEDSGLGDSDRSYLPGLHGKTITLNGFINTTTDALWGPLVKARTSITKTVGFSDGIKYYTGEVYPTDVTISGAVGELNTWSANLTWDGAANQTSVAPA